MTLNEAMTAHGPSWLSLWMPILVLGAFVLPLTLLIWKPTRITAVVSVLAAVLGGVLTNLLYQRLGYVKLLGLPHVVIWTPLVIYLFFKARSPAVSKVPTVIIAIVAVVICISLAFDYLDVASYLLGDRAPAT